MGLAEKLELLITADPKQAVKSLTAVGEAAEKQLGKAEGKAASFGKTMSKVGVGMLGVGAVVTGAFFEMAEAADKAEVVGIKLENSIKNSKSVAEGSIGSFKRLALSLEGKTEADHLSIESGEAFLIQMGATEAQVKSLTPLLVDLSRKQGVDMTAAAKAVGKAINGTAGGLQRMGVVVDKNAFQTDHYKATVEALRRSVGGFAEQEGKTFEGQLVITKNKLRDLEQGVGVGALRAFEKMLGPVQHLSDDFAQLSPKTQANIGEFGAMAGVSLVLAGGVATLAGKLVAARANMAALAEESPVLAASLGAVAKGGFLLAGLDIAGTLANALVPPKVAHVDLTRLTSDLVDLQKKGKLTGEGARTLGVDFGHLKGAIQQIADPTLSNRVSHTITALGKIPTLGKLKGLNEISNAKTVIDGLDKSLAQIASQDPKAASAALEAIRSKIGDKAFARLRPMLNDYSDALAGLHTQSKLTGDSQDELATKTDKVATASKQAATEIGRYLTALSAEFDPLFAAQSAAKGLADAQQGVAQALKEHGRNSPEYIQANRDAVESAYTFEGALARVKQGLADGSIKLDDAKATMQRWVAQGAITQAQADDTAGSFVNLTTKAGQVPTSVHTDVTVSGIAQAEAQLDQLARQRTAIINAIVTQPKGQAPGTGTSGVFVPTKKAMGGWVNGPGGVDQVPAMLTAGEFVINKRAAAMLGGTTLNNLNKVQRFADGGPVLYGSVSQAEWDRLYAAGWRGDPNDGREALYPPTNGGYVYANGTRGWVPEGTVFEDGSVAGTSTIARQAAATAAAAAARAQLAAQAAVHHHNWTIHLPGGADGTQEGRRFIAYIRQWVREHGGDVQKALG